MVTKEMMKIHGIDFVRGGRYCQMTITDLEKKFLRE